MCGKSQLQHGQEAVGSLQTYPKLRFLGKKAFLVVNFQLQLLGCVYEGRNKQGKVMMIVDK